MQPSQPRSSEFDRIELGKPLLDRLQEKFGWRIIPDGTAPLLTIEIPVSLVEVIQKYLAHFYLD